MLPLFGGILMAPGLLKFFIKVCVPEILSWIRFAVFMMFGK
jgi:hypothetical protein